MHQQTYDWSIPKTYYDKYHTPHQGCSFIYIDSNDVNIYLQKRSVEMNPMARDVNRHRQLKEEHPPRIERA